MSNKLLREYVKTVLTEESGDGYYGGGGYGGGYGGDGMIGGSSGGEKLANAFRTSAKMIGGSIKAAGEDMSTRAWTGVKVFQQALLTTIVPFMEEDYKKIFAAEKNKLGQIKQKYAELFKNIDDAVFHEDFVFAAFLYNPAEVITSALAKKAPEAAIELLMILSTGNEKIYEYLRNLKHDASVLAKQDAKNARDTNATSVQTTSDKKSGKTAAVVGGGAAMAAISDQIRNLSKNRKVKEVIENNSVVASMKADADHTIKAVLTEIVNSAEEDLHGAQNIETIKQNYPKVNFDVLDKAPTKEKANLEHQMISSVRKMIKDFHVQQIQSRIKRGIRLGFTKDSEFMQLHQKALEKVRSL